MKDEDDRPNLGATVQQNYLQLENSFFFLGEIQLGTLGCGWLCKNK